MSSQNDEAKKHFIQAVSRIAGFWGFPKAMGAVYGAVYLAPEPVNLDELVSLTEVTKGAVSTHVRALERLKMVRKELRLGDRKDYYVPETDFWQIVKNILAEREQREFDLAISAVGESLEMVRIKDGHSSDKERDFLSSRLEAVKTFFDQIDGIVRVMISIESSGLASVAASFTGKGNANA
ncbi:MAG: hypothetical protein HZB23_07450 [Deltaproteobacteria bacterium]|nr:hypothetical protein [Deltaproteobacteria bacterium]